MNFFLLVFVLPREFWRQQTAKSKHIFEIEEGRRGVEVVGSLPFGVPTWGRWCGVPAFVLWSCVPSFCPLSRSSLGAFPLKYAFIRVLRAFLAWFVGFVWVRLACVLCVACGAFVCVRG